MANPVIQAKNSTAFTGTNSVSLTKPTGTTDGDLLVAYIAFFDGNETVNSLPSGWSTEASEYTSNEGLLIATKQAGSSEPTSYSFGISDVVFAGGVIFRIDNIATDNEVAGAEILFEGTPGGVSMTKGVSVTPNSDESLVLIGFKPTNFNEPNFSINGYASTPSLTYTEEFELSASQGGGPLSNRIALAVASAEKDDKTEITQITADNNTAPANYHASILVINAPGNATVTPDANTLNSVNPSPTISTDSNITLGGLGLNTETQLFDLTIVTNPERSQAEDKPESGTWTPEDKP